MYHADRFKCFDAPGQKHILLIDHRSQLISLTVGVRQIYLMSGHLTSCLSLVWSVLTDWLQMIIPLAALCSLAEIAHSEGLLHPHRSQGGGDDWRWIPSVILHSSVPDYLKRWAMFESMSLISHIGLCLAQRAIILPNNFHCRALKGNK